MLQIKHQQWLIASVYCAAIFSLPGRPVPAEADLTDRTRVKIMFMFKETDGEGIQAVENALSRLFENHGYNVLDRDVVAQTLSREADLRKLYEVEAAKHLGSRLGADIVVSGGSKARVEKKTVSALGGKTTVVSQADVNAKAILVGSGKVIVAESAHARRPFDTTGEIALEMAAEALASKLIEKIDQFLNRETIDYRLVILNANYQQSAALQEALRNKVKGVRQVSERGFIQNSLDLDVSVEKKEDVTFKNSILISPFSGLGLGRFELVGREGEVIYLQRVGGEVPERTRPRPGEPRSQTGVKPEPKPAEPQLPVVNSNPGKVSYRKSWAVVIGINNYRQWPKLEYAVSDARAVAKLLPSLGFDEVITLIDGEATRQNILRVLGDELYEKTQDDDRLLIFFAGHGQTQDLPDGSRVGYIIPVEGDLKSYYSTAISMRQLQDLSARIRAKHIFYVMDSCFSGLLLNLRGISAVREESTGTSSPATQIIARARQVLTAGGAGEPVTEVGGHGLFTKLFLEGLQGAADIDRDGSITANELYQFVTPRISQESQNAQNPAFGRLGSGVGEFVFKQG
ncbi:MAG: caspase family protein [Candidatus Tectomicrobia bacterium]|nr:caspase family protein [Candidatus Tectomicrobia bacterium]